MKCDSKGIAGEPVNCNLTFMTQDPSLIVNVTSSWNSYYGSGFFMKTFGILDRK